MKAAVIDAPGKLAVRDVPSPVPAPGEVIVSLALGGLCGTDLHIFAGELNYGYPIIAGHEVVGTIAEIGEGVFDLDVGMRVAFDPNIACGSCHYCQKMRFNHCLHWEGIGVTRDGGFAERVAVPASVIYPIGNMPFDQAVFIEPLSCVVYGLQRATPSLGDKVLILGAGPIGLLLMQSVRRAGAASVVITDVQRDRLDLASRLGAEAAMQAGDGQRDALFDLAPYGYDMVIDATGAPAVAASAFDYVTRGGKVLLFGVCPEDATIPFSPFKIYRHDISVYGSFALNKSFGPAIELLKSGAVQVGDLISHRFSLDRFPAALELALSRSEPTMKILIEP